MQKLLFNIIIYFVLVFILPSCSILTNGQKTYSINEMASDGAWTWYNDERVIVVDDCLLIGSLDSKGVSRVDVYDMQTGAKQSYPLSTWKSKDDHNNPALLEMSNGQILACYAQHGCQKQWNWRIAERVNGNSIVDLKWSPEHTFVVQSPTTYNNLMQLSAENERIYNFSRNLNFNPNIQYSDDMAKTWQGPILFLKTGDGKIRPYVKYADNGKDRIDFLYTDGHPRKEAKNSVYHMYYQEGSFFKSDGTLIKTMAQVRQKPIHPKQGTMIYDGSTCGRGWNWDIEYDKDGNPVGAFVNSVDHEDGNDLRYRYAHWDPKSGKWNQQQIAFAGTHLYEKEKHYAGGFSIDPDNTDIVYISTDVDPVTGHTNNYGRYQIFQGKKSDQDEIWNWKQLTFDTDVDNLRPFVPRRHGHQTCVIWFQGRYATYQDYKTKIMGIIEE